jgi:hypothetical protein
MVTQKHGKGRNELEKERKILFRNRDTFLQDCTVSRYVKPQTEDLFTMSTKPLGSLEISVNTVFSRRRYIPQRAQ